MSEDYTKIHTQAIQFGEQCTKIERGGRKWKSSFIVSKEDWVNLILRSSPVRWVHRLSFNWLIYLVAFLTCANNQALLFVEPFIEPFNNIKAGRKTRYNRTSTSSSPYLFSSFHHLSFLFLCPMLTRPWHQDHQLLL